MGRVSSGNAVSSDAGGGLVERRELRNKKCCGKTDFGGKFGLVYLIYYCYHKLRLVYSDCWGKGFVTSILGGKNEKGKRCADFIWA